MESIYHQTMKLQHSLDMADDEQTRTAAAKKELAAINGRWNPLLKRLVRTESAYFIDDGLTLDSYINPVVRFEETILKGTVPKIGYISVGGRMILSIPFFNSVVLGPQQEIEPQLVDYELDGYDTALPLNKPIVRPIHVPVEHIKFITFAA